MIDKKLVAGPFVGEFGWELFCWQGWLRRLSKEYTQTAVICREGHEALYKDFADCIVPIQAPSDTDSENCRSFVYQNEHDRYPDRDWANPFVRRAVFVNGCPYIAQQDFVDLSFSRYEKTKTVCIHARDTLKCSTADRNWPKHQWEEIVRFLTSFGYDVKSIGTLGAARHIEDTTDLRGIDLAHLCAELSKSVLVLGPSSGPMHLASLCRVPHIVWSGDGKNLIRYTKLWNPLQTWSKHMSLGHGWQPTTDAVKAEIQEFYDDNPLFGSVRP